MCPAISTRTATTLCASMKKVGRDDARGWGRISIMRLSTSWANTWTTPVAPISRAPRTRRMPVSLSMSGGLRLAEQMVGDDALLYLGRALEDLGEPRIAPVTLDGVERRVARAAEDLQRFRRHPLGHLGG